MGQKVIIRFWWESELSSTSRNHLTTLCRSFIHYAYFKIVFRYSTLYPKQLPFFVCYGWSEQALTALATLPIYA